MLAALAVLAALAAQPAWADAWVHTAIDGGGACGRILADGVFYTWYSTLPPSTSRSVSQSAFQSAMCSSATKPAELWTGPGGVKSFGISIGDQQFAFARSSIEAQTRLGIYKSTLCNSASDIGLPAIATYSAWIDPNLLTAYEGCLAMAEAGLSLDAVISKDGNIITITLGYTKKDKGGVLFQRSAVNGPAFCKYLTDAPSRRPIKPGFMLTAASGKHSIQCERRTDSTDKQAVSVIVATSAGSRRFDLPDLVPPTVEERLNARLDDIQDVIDTQLVKLQATVTQLQVRLAVLSRQLAATAAAGPKKPAPQKKQ